jgi:hypothetical protein
MGKRGSGKIGRRIGREEKTERRRWVTKREQEKDGNGVSKEIKKEGDGGRT